jgi:hypothetical protein
MEKHRREPPISSAAVLALIFSNYFAALTTNISFVARHQTIAMQHPHHHL